MGVRSLTTSLLLAGATLSHLVAAQTIVVEDTVLAANETTVAPAAEPVDVPETEIPLSEAEVVQLTDSVIANLTEFQLSSVELFDFAPADENATNFEKRFFGQPKCKTFPGDFLWPSKLVWKVFDLLTGGALIETVPIGAVCFKTSGVYNAAKCQTLLDNWGNHEVHTNDPTSVMTVLYQGETCKPQTGAADPSARCTLGSFPSYSVEVRNVAQIQLAINFARNANIRLVVHNTGHDFLGKSTGAGSLSIWTHKLKSIQYLKSVRTKSYSGPAMKLGAGVQVHELYEEADRRGVTALGGECDSVGVSGGYLAGGGHGPLSSKYGMAADHVLSIDVVLPNGRFVTADENQNTDLFWALRGGGGATFGVVTSMTVKVFPKMKFAGAKWEVVTPAYGLSEDTFFKVMFAYWRRFPEYAAKNTYGYSTVFPIGPQQYLWAMQPWLVPDMTLVQFKAMIAPLLAEWQALGFNIQPTYFEYDNFYATWRDTFPHSNVTMEGLRTGSRLFPASNWENNATLNGLMEAMKTSVQMGSALIQYNMKGTQQAGTPASAVNTHWRTANWFAIMGAGWTPGNQSDFDVVNRRITNDWMERLKQWGPGGYGNEGDVMESNFGEAFFGSNYKRLLQIKRSVDPNDVFWAPTAVGSDRWKVEGSSWLPIQTGRLCRV
ncbi:6-hydroxy-D-nicotine oxidase [Rhypophila decipiens]|uniref:6-hydroxy-D-nicotine oxidase n=1 Tax=Rhypophila decipiens TaxID=261697 RepID=A0AAN7B231_9PEZI|nr:6-hydroxy-D-nicotine oxidase [Rhypophila decipiens]